MNRPSCSSAPVCKFGIIRDLGIAWLGVDCFLGFRYDVCINREKLGLECGGLCFLAFYGGNDFLNFERKLIQNFRVTTSQLGFAILGRNRELKVVV